MSEHPGQRPDDSQPLDSELSFRGIVYFTVGLVATVIIAGVLMWLLTTWLRDRRIAADPPLPVLPEARQYYEPPEPRLQPSPPADMKRFLAEQRAEVESYAWVDQQGGVARVPVERAMEIVAERGWYAGTDAAGTTAPTPLQEPQP